MDATDPYTLIYDTMILPPLLKLLYPASCLVCGTPLSGREECICRFCLPHLPHTGFHLQPDNKAEQLFFGKAEIERCACFCYFRKGDRFRELIHEFKYRDNRKAAYRMGRLYARILQADRWDAPFACIIPVPLHPFKKIRRGYNQSEWIARGIASVWQTPLRNDILYKRKATSTQTRKGFFERHANASGSFAVREAPALEGRHILLIDDVLTSGSTLTACIGALRQAANVKISILTLGFAE